MTGLQIRNSNKTSMADFAHRFKNDFQKDQTRELIIMFDLDLLIFNYNSDCVAYFEFDYNKYKQLQDTTILQIKPKKIYSAYEIDDNLLMYFQDIGYYLDNKLLDIDFVYNHFYNYTTIIYEKPNITKYIQNIRTYDSEYFNYIDTLYDKLKKKASH